MATQNPMRIPNPTEGIIRSESVDDFVSEQSSVQLGMNVHYDRIGATTVRPGLSVYTEPVTSPTTLALWNNLTTRKLIVQDGSDLKAWDGSTWTTIKSGLTGGKVRWSQFLGRTYFVNGYNGDPIESYDGTTYGANNVGALPKGDYIQAGFDSRIWVADKNEDKLYFTDQFDINYDIFGGTSYMAGFFPQNGQSITALYRFQKALLVFKPDSIFRVYGANNQDPYPAYFVGTYSQESIVQSKDGIYFHHSTGFYKFSYDSQPQEVSKRISDVVAAIPRANYESVFGWDEPDAVCWAVGPTTLEGKTYRNLVCRYTVSTQTWTFYDYFSKAGSTRNLTAALRYDDGTNLIRVAAVDDGNIVKINSGSLDIDEPVFYEEISRWITFTDTQSTLQEIKAMAGIHLNAAGAHYDAQVDNDTPNKWTQIGRYDQNYVTLFNSVNLVPFNRARFRKSGANEGTPPIFITNEILSFNEVGMRNQ